MCPSPFEAFGVCNHLGNFSLEGGLGHQVILIEMMDDNLAFDLKTSLFH